MAALKQKLSAVQSREYKLEIKRTANAGVLLKVDGISFLLDGVCNEYAKYSYLGTPDSLRKELSDNFPDVLAYTHWHEDHFDSSYADAYKKTTLRPVYGPELSITEKIGNVSFTSISSRHIGKYTEAHVSYIIEGSKCIWFMGDASPLMWKNVGDYPSPDILIVPYAYAITDAAWKITKDFGAKAIVLLHLPRKEKDVYGLWDAVIKTAGNDDSLFIPEIGQVLNF